MLRFSCILVVGGAPFLLAAGEGSGNQPDAPGDAGQPAAPTVQELDECAFPVTAIHLRYIEAVADHPGLPAIETLMDLPMTIGRVQDGYVSPARANQSGGSVETVTLRSLASDTPMQYGSSALRAIVEQIQGYFENERHIMAVRVIPSEEEIRIAYQDVTQDDGTVVRQTTACDDYRGDQTDLDVVVQVGVISELRSLASGRRTEGRIERTNLAMHKRIRELSPLKPAGQVDANVDIQSTDLLRIDELNRYLFWLSRHPGRRVDVTVGRGLDPGTIALDYLVTEEKPWLAYFRVSNTGTASTDRIRERFGFIHNQLTNNDDIFRLDYVTAGFDESHAVLGSYEFPLLQKKGHRLRTRLFGSWNQFTASDVGLPGLTFEGDGYEAGGEIIANIFQRDALFVDLVGGAKWQFVRVDQGLVGEGESGFFIPYASLQFDRDIGRTVTSGSLGFEAGFADAGENELELLGRPNPDSQWYALTWNVSHSAYLEPLLNREAWNDPSTPRSSTLAHEIVLAVKGQEAFDYRLVPNFEEVLGGLYSVRGYPQSVVAGDNVIVATVEYRLHIPRLFEPAPQGKEQRGFFGNPFKWRPERVYGSPDWDVVPRVFFDVGHVEKNKPLAFEKDQTLSSFGVGVGVQIRRNFNFEVDWGFALNEINDSGVHVDNSSNRIHFVGTITF